MKEWWNRKKIKTRRKKNNEKYSILDFIVDFLFWLPELVLLPFRLIIWLIRGVGRGLRNVFDIF
ncbi:hypothetical protein CR203_01875 [Salipaludibacillus neizhouensis]|uniref:Uncharacterized protein n=1 Tax=Salipaludibacillus neizhouensis TaxID=885475 RepID=A0A3A9KB41_9BACI|nr:hypothetical protein [Salipaludibacillus neizhouensis]RKL68818.1 hypothetical protein CR203_01875 [Salipaludibacillus neizhouensis]